MNTLLQNIFGVIIYGFAVVGVKHIFFPKKKRERHHLDKNFFWDDTNHRLGIGTTVPTKKREKK